MNLEKTLARQNKERPFEKVLDPSVSPAFG
jgi:hypothetical protein